jgi:NAD(P)-dependent dehydrogenase (short-subunit alcohol dehydrogenase family)
MGNTNQQRVVIVTGAFGALGRAVAQRFAAGGDAVGLLDRGAVPPELAREFVAPHLLIPGVDLTDAASTAKLDGGTHHEDRCAGQCGGRISL